MIKSIARWAKMKKQAYHEVGIFNVTITAPANYVGWAMLGTELFFWCALGLTVKYWMS
jgi:hypothetical protein